MRELMQKTAFLAFQYYLSIANIHNILVSFLTISGSRTQTFSGQVWPLYLKMCNFEKKLF